MADDTEGTPPEEVATRWFGDWKVPSKEPDQLDGVAGQIDAIALRLAPISGAGAGWPGHGQRDGLDAVGLAARRFAVCLRRLAASERIQSQPVCRTRLPDES